MMTVSAWQTFAQGTGVQRAACTPDVFRFCSGEIPNVARITACLKREKASLRAGCQGVFNSLERTRVGTRSIEADPAAGGQEIWTAWCRAGTSAD